MSEHWFKPATWGYGAEPASWKGRAAVFAFGLALVALFAVVTMFFDGRSSVLKTAGVSAIFGIEITHFSNLFGEIPLGVGSFVGPKSTFSTDLRTKNA